MTMTIQAFQAMWRDAKLKQRALTNLYSQRSSRLANDHAALNHAVWDAYGWDGPDHGVTPEDANLARLLVLNLERAADGA